ncbi:acyltransferase [Marilutibacter chinensis]|uniref:Acyltransferase n=1 Tax=Marilutibacter chinensis TaxID=2912247 RepID=A0ABS9HSP0_9GAMM|nr:acyltransferase [Lysobacter chinensis]MCF7221698.1 acyltransferase [Lysobacter chinensis]
MSADHSPRGGDWTRRPEGGGRFALWLISTIARRGGRAPARALLYPITLYFLLTRGPERRASRAYLDRVLGRPARLWDVARHIHTFASTILDRVFLLGGQRQRYDIRVEGLDVLEGHLARGTGALLFGAHLGSFDALRALAASRPDVQVRVVLDKRHNPAIVEVLDALNPELARRVIDAGQDGPAIVLAIREALEENALVAVLADRARPGEPVRHAPFLGGQAGFPTAPWAIAAVLGRPVVLAFGLFRGGNRYDLVFEAFEDAPAVPRAERARVLPTWIRRYAGRLQARVLDAPYNWFNFYDFWQDDDARSVANRTGPPQGDAHPRDAAGADPGGSGGATAARRPS